MLYSPAQLLRTLIENLTPPECQDGYPEQIVLRLVNLLGNRTIGDVISWDELFDLVADVYSDSVLWDFSEGE